MFYFAEIQNKFIRRFQQNPIWWHLIKCDPLKLKQIEAKHNTHTHALSYTFSLFSASIYDENAS